jgi:hypothetical protein
MSTSPARKGQTGYEFIALMSFLLLVFAAVLLVVTQRGAQLSSDNARASAQQVADNLAREMRYAYIGGQGYAREFDIPLRLYGINYSITLIHAAGANATMLMLNSTSIASPVLVPVPFALSVQYESRDNAAISTSESYATLLLPLWVEE